MASLGGNISGPDIGPKLIYPAVGTAFCIAIALSRVASRNRCKTADGGSGNKGSAGSPSLLWSFLVFFYNCFLKPHQGGNRGTQQDALESFYKKQAGIYDVTRKALLKGREDMLALVAAQLSYKVEKQHRKNGGSKRTQIWVDIGGGTGWNIEAMNAFVNVPEFFSSVYLVDFSPSLCEVAAKRFERLGWTNVKVICEDSRRFRLEDHEKTTKAKTQAGSVGGADLITMSYSLSMIPDFYSVVDSLAALLAPDGIMGVVDFYVQSKVDFGFRNYTGGLVGRHTNFLGRTFWRSWFDLDRVSLEPARRDYLEYQFGTVLSVNKRNRALGSIPYYVWIGRPKAYRPGDAKQLAEEDRIAQPKALQVAAQNRAANLPLPSFSYQNQPWRVFYDDQLQKHKQFNDEYIYAFTWEDTRVDERLLQLGADDAILAITSAGDNILSYALQSPARIHAVDLNPAQNHLLELKLAAYSALSYDDFWRLFGEGKHEGFRSLLVSRLSPHMSSRAFQYWFANAHIFEKTRGGGLYDTGASKRAIRAFHWISYAFGCRDALRALLRCKTLNEQREIWRARIRPALLSQVVSRFVVGQEAFLWSALGVPRNQLAMIEADHAVSEAVRGPLPTASNTRSAAIWGFMAGTLDPVAEHSLIAADNPYYHVCLAGAFSRRCHPDYLSPQAHTRLSRPGAFDGLRIHTEELDVVLAGLAPCSLSIAVVMDSMDWFDPSRPDVAASQISRLNKALAPGGRVLLRSAALTPWYVKEFASQGFRPTRVGARDQPGALVDRVNMYASCWLMHKVANLPPPTPVMEGAEGGVLPPMML